MPKQPKPVRPSKSSTPAQRAASSRQATPSRQQAQPKQAGSIRKSQERARDEAREAGGPRYAGGPWRVADERGERRYGHARIDDADPAELSPAELDYADDARPTAGDPELAAAEAAGEIVSGGEREGIGRAEHPRKPKRRGK